MAVGEGSVVALPVTPMHEQALEYLAKLEQADAYDGKVDSKMVDVASSRLILSWVVMVTVL